MDCVNKYYQTNVRPLIEKYVLEDGGGAAPTLYIASAAAVIISALLWRSSRLTSGKRKQKRAKKHTKEYEKKPLPMTLERQIESVRLRFNEEYKDHVLQLINDFDAKDEKKIFKRNYYNEMLLKLLIELDGIDLVDVKGDRKAQLKEGRKAVIRDIQTHLKKLDKLK